MLTRIILSNILSKECINVTTIMTDRILYYLQHHWALFDLMDHWTKAERKHEERFENYIDSIIKWRTLPLSRTININNNDIYTHLTIRSLEGEDLVERLRKHEELIKGSGVEALYNYGDIIRYILPSGEIILLEVSSPIYKDDTNGIPFEGHYTTPIESATKTPRQLHTKIRYIEENVFQATEADKIYFKLINLFKRCEREFGEFLNGDLFFDKDENHIFSYHDQDTKALIDSIISGEIKFIATKSDIVYDYIEEGSLLG